MTHFALPPPTAYKASKMSDEDLTIRKGREEEVGTLEANGELSRCSFVEAAIVAFLLFEAAKKGRSVKPTAVAYDYVIFAYSISGRMIDDLNGYPSEFCFLVVPQESTDSTLKEPLLPSRRPLQVRYM
ncbi:hypothetical protein PIIN_00391 [Serendipita indica DSM 11827]|uniref:Uncharacterized protein n=1 Tax=Serendipita indica (strain DSM 11827) TaxID=1109443 RepID=G4T602_SERID|nr:hypothetical protein PIIN_00391 [Serendipita indica DSM 11827]